MKVTLSSPFYSLILVLGYLVCSGHAFAPRGVPVLHHSSTCLAAASSKIEDVLCPLMERPRDPLATFEAAMGWFWGPQRDFDTVDIAGITGPTVVGYSGSQDPVARPNPTYENILDYAESIRVTFDPTKVSYQDMLDLFFSFHTPADPRFATTQYRSAIFYHTPEQAQMAQQAVQARGALGKFIAVEPASDFYRAEEYHQKFIQKQVQSMFQEDPVELEI